MVGSVLMDRMRADNDFSGIESVFFSTSQVGQDAPAEATEPGLLDAMSTNELASCDVVVTCQGGDYTELVYGPLRESGWDDKELDKLTKQNLFGSRINDPGISVANVKEWGIRLDNQRPAEHLRELIRSTYK